MHLILHITDYRAWVEAQEEGEYRPDSLHEVGFIHCATPAQVAGVANSMFAGARDLVLLCIDADAAEGELRYEDCYDTGTRFPHLYGPLNLDAVVEVLPFAADEDGVFHLPATVGSHVSSIPCDYPILEYDPAPEAHIEPGCLLAPADIPDHCVLCFFQDVITNLKEEGRLQLLRNLASEIGHNPVYTLDVDGQRLALCHPGVGAPLAAAFMDELIALGARHFIICGGAGVLDSHLSVGHIIVPTVAVRDEGTSYHYLPPAREVAASERAVAAIEQALQADNVDYVRGKTWTTDGVYRETAGKIRRRRAAGCVTVEMEAAAFFAVAAFRNVEAGQILYGGDDVGSDEWQSRHWQQQTSVREKLFWLAAEACLRL